MSRPLRITYPGAFYHVTSRGNEKKKIFKSKRDREKFLEYLGSAVQRYEAVIHAFCLMDNHYHLMLETPTGNMPQIMRHINGAYTTYFNVKRERSGHLLQGRYKAILVEKDEYAKELSRYIHLNPVRAKIVQTPDEYEWSSYLYYVGNKKSPKWLCRDFILGYFGRTTLKAQTEYSHYVNVLVNAKYNSPLNDVVSSTILGSPDFITFIKKRFLSGKKIDRNLPALKELSEKASMANIFDEVETVFVHEPALTRNIKIYLCHKYTGESLKEIGKQLGIGESGVSQTSRRMNDKIKNDKRLRKKISKIEKKLNL